MSLDVRSALQARRTHSSDACGSLLTRAALAQLGVRMTAYLTSFATAEFSHSLGDLMQSAQSCGIDSAEPWNPERLRGTSFYEQHRSVLDHPKHAGFRLWKPFIIEQLLGQVFDGDIAVYADAGISVVRPLLPLFSLCRETGGILLCSGSDEDLAGRPDRCCVWTKRDCFVLMNCDSGAYYDAPMVDASFLVFSKNARSVEFVRHWLELCCRPEVLTDAPNVCGKPNLPGYFKHRHDQSVLSLLTAQHGLELFRNPSQFGNHCKMEQFRETDEWTSKPYGVGGIHYNSRYATLLFHHRKQALRALVGTQPTNCLSIVDTIVGMYPDLFSSVRVLEVGSEGDGDTVAAWRDPSTSPFVRHSRVLQLDRSSAEQLRGSEFDIILLRRESQSLSISSELDTIIGGELLAEDVFALCWYGLEGIQGWMDFRSLESAVARRFPKWHIFSRLAWVHSSDSANKGKPLTVGIISGVYVRSLEARRPPDTAKKSMHRDYIITGIPRSGTSLLCRLCDDQEDSVAVNEPWEAIAAVRLKNYHSVLIELHAHLRSEILSGRPILNKLTDGRVTTDTASSEQWQAYRPMISSHNFLLGTKDTLQYLSRLDTFRGRLQGMSVVVCVRDPRSTIASWKHSFEHLANADIDWLVSRGALGSRLPACAQAMAVMRSTEDVRVRRALLWRYLAEIISRNREWISLIKYEDLTTDTRAVLGRVIPILDPLRPSSRVVVNTCIRPSARATTADSVETDLIWDVCGEEASRFGYEKERRDTGTERCEATSAAHRNAHMSIGVY